jgi:hypothetical protein
MNGQDCRPSSRTSTHRPAHRFAIELADPTIEQANPAFFPGNGAIKIYLAHVPHILLQVLA